MDKNNSVSNTSNTRDTTKSYKKNIHLEAKDLEKEQINNVDISNDFSPTLDHVSNLMSPNTLIHNSLHFINPDV